MKRFLFLCLLCILIIGCSPKADLNQSSLENDDSSKEIIDAPFERPNDNGIFVQINENFIEIEPGKVSSLMPTNAKRGFGFGMPIGSILNEDVNIITIYNPNINASQLQITLFKGVAVNADNWFSDVDDSNTAWIPAEHVKSKVQIINKLDGFAQLKLQNPLPPGFYVLHDNSLMKSRNADEVSFYYPFIVTNSNKKDPWIDDADTCFKDIFKKYQDHVKLDDNKQHVLNDVKKCAAKQRVAWKNHSHDDSDNEYKLRLIYLSRLIDAFSDDVHRAILDNMDENGTDTTQLLWKIEQYDQMQRLNLLAQNKGDESILHAVIQYYHIDSRETSLKTLLWLPFLWLENNDPQLDIYFNDIRLDNNWEHTLVELLGAVQYKQLFSEARKHKSLAPWFKKIDAEIGKVFKQKSVSLSFRHEKAKTVIGPIAFTGVPDADISTWRATLKSFDKDVRKCADVKFNGSYTLILEQPLTGDIYGKASRGVMHDPVASIRKGVVPPPDVIDCILDVYTRIPASAAIDVNQKASIAISVSQ